MPGIRLSFGLKALLLTLLALRAYGEPIPVSIIIDDLGYNFAHGHRAIQLPGNFTYSVLPNTPYAKQLAELANRHNKEVMLHLPMEGSYPAAIEPDTLTTGMPETEFKQILSAQLQYVPYIAGVNNHMGSVITPLIPQMHWIMEELLNRNLYYIDSRTTEKTVASVVAAERGVAFSQRDAFLDNLKTADGIKKAFDRFIQQAVQRNGAIAIAHPHKITLDTLEMLIPELEKHNLRLISVSEMIRWQTQNAKKLQLVRSNANFKTRSLAVVKNGSSEEWK